MGTAPHELLLGFDAREMWMAESRPSEFLLRDGIERVLSTDTTVWPSLFDSHAALLERPEWVGANGPFWEDLGALELALAPVDRREFPYWLIAASWHTDMGFGRESRLYKKYTRIDQTPQFRPTNPAVRDPAWRFLGFDVADPGIGGLTNCGYTEEERGQLARQWSPWLNQHHLLTDLEKAFEFRALSNRRVREHAPFYVIGLWLVLDAASPE